MTMTKLNSEIRELTIDELDAVSAGGIFADAFEWVASKVRSDEYFHPVSYPGGGGGARG